MVEIVLVCCERQRTECRIRLKNNAIDTACEEKQYSLEIRNNISNAFVCLSVYIKKIYTDVFEQNL